MTDSKEDQVLVDLEECGDVKDSEFSAEEKRALKKLAKLGYVEILWHLTPLGKKYYQGQKD